MVFNIMKRLWAYILVLRSEALLRRVAIVGLLSLAVFSETLLATGSYNISPTTVPPSMRREGLIQSPSAVDGSGNLLITGNIRGPGYFRGVVPYSASTDFGVTLPSSALDTFLRDSTSVTDVTGSRYPSYGLGYKPFYSRTQTASSTIAGAPLTPSIPAGAGVSAANISPDAVQSYINGTLPVRRDEVLDTTSALSLARLRPMSMTPEEMQKLINSEIAEYSPARLTEQQYKPEEEQYKLNIGQEKGYKTGEINNPLTSPLLPSGLQKPAGEANQPSGIPVQEEQTAEGQFGVPWVADLNSMNTRFDVYDLMKQQLDNLQKKIDLAMVTPQQPVKEKAAEEAGEQTKEKTQSNKLAEADLAAARGWNVLGPYKTFASFSQDKFNQNMRAGELYLKQGRFYRAADAYTLASLYKPNDPLAYVGKSHALFASGEYMSSALYLSRALQIFPGYARFKVDLAAMVGDKDKLESRVVDVEEWFKRSGAPELQFLLAYLYYQMDRPQPAKEAIDAAYEKMPDSVAVLALKKAIDASLPANEGGSQRITDGKETPLNWPREKK